MHQDYSTAESTIIGLEVPGRGLAEQGDDSSAKHLQVLLGMKAKVGYSHKRATAAT